MFSKLHPQHFQLQTSQDYDSHKSVMAADGATIEVPRRSRGRPPGSKNKPKPPLLITRHLDPAMTPFLLEVPAGADVVHALTRFTRTHNTSLCVLTASGTVSNLTLRQPSFTPPTVTFHGRFHILSMSATFLLPPPPLPPTSFAISLAGPQGQIIGGLVAGTLIAAGTVFVIASSFNNPSFHRLSSEEEEDAHNNSGSGDAPSPPVSGGGGGAESGHVPCMYSCHLPSDVIWAPTARPPF